MKFKPTTSSKRKGNALLIAVLLTSILLLITVGLSRLVSSETRQISNMIRNGKAEYLAEGGTEMGQLIYYNILEGSESKFDGEYTLNLGTEYSLSGNSSQEPMQVRFNIEGVTNHIPYASKELILASKTDDELKKQLFQALLPGESVEIFIDNGKTDFVVEYYLPAVNATALGEFKQGDLDVLLFKLSGVRTTPSANPEEDQEFIIDFITEYFPAGSPQNSANTLMGKSVSNPAKIGTNNLSGIMFNGGTLFPYSDEVTAEMDSIVRIDESGQVTFEAQKLNETQTFSEFISKHKNNIISLTNGVNLAQIRTPETQDYANLTKLREALGTIYYRVCAAQDCGIVENEIQNNKDSNGLTSPFVGIDSTVTFQGVTKNVTTRLSRANAFSVFDFAIYRTSNEE
jgi:hypothetical protein